MNILRKLMLALALAAGLTATGTGIATATNWYPNDIQNLTSFLDGVSKHQVAGSTVAGSFYVTPLAYQSYLTNQFRDASDQVLFTNNLLPQEFGTVKYANLSGADFRTTGTYNYPSGGSGYVDFTTALTDASRVHIYQLDQNWTYNGMSFSVGSLIIGINDDKVQSACTDDFDDFILAASRTAPTPLPGAVWLLGSGLAGAFGFRRLRRTS